MQLDIPIPANQQKAAEFAVMTIPFSLVVVVPTISQEPVAIVKESPKSGEVD